MQSCAVYLSGHALLIARKVEMAAVGHDDISVPTGNCALVRLEMWGVVSQVLHLGPPRPECCLSAGFLVACRSIADRVVCWGNDDFAGWWSRTVTIKTN